MIDITPKYEIIASKYKVIADDVEFAMRVGGLQANATSVQQGDGNDIFKVSPKGIHLGAAEFEDAPFYVDMQGNLHATSGTFSGDITGATGTFSGTVAVGSLDIPNATSADSFHVDATGNMWLGAATFAAAVASISKAGVGTFSNITITGGSIASTPISSIPNNSSTDISLLEFSHDLVFSVTDADTIAWAAGTIVMSNGRSFSIDAGNTGNMSALTYIYLDTGVSSTVLQTTTTYSTAMGANKVLLGMAQNNTVTASFIPRGGGQPLIDGGNIGALSIIAGNIAASTITSDKLSVSQLSAITADMGSLTAGSISVVAGANTIGLTPAGANAIFSGTTGSPQFAVTPAGAVTASNITITGGSILTSVLSGLVAQANLNIANMGWTQTSAFSVTDADTVAWGAGTFTTAGGTSYSIGASNTGNMVARTYIYLDIAVSTTAYQTTTTATTAVGTGKVLVATAINGTNEATFQVFNGVGGLNISGLDIALLSITEAEIANTTITAGKIVANTITASQIAAGTITTTEIAASTIVAGNIAAGTITGTQIAASTITAGLISVTSLAAINADLGAITAGSISVVSGANTIGLTPAGANAIFSGTTGSPEFRVTPGGALTATSATITGAITISSGSGIANLSDAGALATVSVVTPALANIALQGWTYDGAFSVTDADTVAWATGTLTTSAGTTYSITGANTGNMAAKTYIYLDIAVSTTLFQTTTTSTTAQGAGKILVAVAQNGTGEATFFKFDDSVLNLDATSIVANSITANEIAASTITAGLMSISQLSAITADMGAITAGSIVLPSGGFIRSGQTAYDTGIGWYIANDGGTPKFSIGDSTLDKITWDGSTLTIRGITKVERRIEAGETFTVTTPVPVTIGNGTDVVNQLTITATNTEEQFGGAANVEKVAQSVQETSAMIVNQLKVFIRKVNSPTDSIKFSIQADTAGAPSGTALASVTKLGSSLSATNTEETLALDVTIVLSANTKYWIVAERTSALDATNNYAWRGHSTTTYANGAGATLVNGTWTAQIPADYQLLLDLVMESGKFYRADANDSARDLFIGFATASTTFHTDSTIVLMGVVDGFSSLTVGVTYYVQDAIGTIGTTAGSVSLPIGISLSSTEILIDKT